MIIYVLSWRFLSRKVAKIKIWASKNVATLHGSDGERRAIQLQRNLCVREGGNIPL